MKKSMIWLIALAAVAVIAIGTYVSLRNSMVQKNEAVKESWSEVDVQMQRRADLIPNLVEIAKGYIKHERETLEAVIQARTTAMVVLLLGRHDSHHAVRDVHRALRCGASLLQVYTA